MKMRKIVVNWPLSWLQVNVKVYAYDPELQLQYPPFIIKKRDEKHSANNGQDSR